MSDRTVGLHVRARSGPGLLHQLSGVIARHQGDITSVEIVERTAESSRVYFEVALPGEADALVAELRGTDAVLGLDVVETFQRVYGKRVIIMGGGAQVGLNMAGSVPEAADLVVTDPVQAGVMAVMAVAETAKFTVERLKRRSF